MPDWWKSTLHPSPAAESLAGSTAETSTSHGFDPQCLLIEIVAELYDIARRLAAIEAALPEAGERFDWRAELRGRIYCVRHDLLEDAIDTLKVGATSTPADFLRHTLERERLEHRQLEQPPSA